MPLAPDLDLARRFLQQHLPLGRVLVCAVTGSHQYGFPSPDSDLDLKGIHVAPTGQVLGLSRPPDAWDRLVQFEGTECDLTTNELGRALALMLAGNGNMLERIFSPLRVYDGPELPALRDLARGSLSVACYDHYRGYFGGMQREHLRTPPRAKSLLYTYRVALTGVHLLRTGQVEAHLPTLAPMYGFDAVLGLVARKVESREQVVLTPAEAAPHEARWTDLQALLDDAKEQSELPPGPVNGHDCERWLIGVRRAEL